MRLSEALLESMNMIDETYLAASENEKKNVFAWKPFLSFAAVCMLVMAVIILPRRLSGSSEAYGGVTNDTAAAESEAVEEESVYDGFAPGAVMFDQALSEYLSEMQEGDTVMVRIERIGPETDISAHNSENKNAEMPAEYEQETAAGEIAEMTKEELLSFEGEDGITYIFHLYNENDME